jgi:DNA-binding NarL/FixJ family response regulator
VTTGRELLDALEDQIADCLLLDLGMPECNGLELIAEVRRIRPAMKILVVTMHNDLQVAAAALRVGANGFVSKEVDSGELLSAIAEVLTGKQHVSPRLHKHGQFAGLEARHSALSHLTPRQHQIVLLIGEGRSLKEIAELLELGPSTITFHEHNIMEKLGCRTKGSLLRYAILLRAEMAGDQASSLGSVAPPVID